MIKITKVSNFGAGHPTIARLGPGVRDLVQFSDISKADQERVLECTWIIARDLASAQQLAAEVSGEIRQIEADLLRNGVRRDGQLVHLPSALKLDRAVDFIVRAKKVLQSAMPLIEVFWGKKFKSAHYHKALSWARTTAGQNAPLAKLLEDDATWIEHIIALRNEEEHPSGRGPFIRNFDAKRRPDGRVEIIPPTFFDGTQVGNALNVFGQNLLTFVEELVALGVTHTFTHPNLVIAEIPVEQRDATMPIRFRVTLNGDMRAKVAAAEVSAQRGGPDLPEAGSVAPPKKGEQ